MEESANDNINPEDTIKILIATDIHLGHEHIKGACIDDSFVTFEEILQYGTEHNVDFVLLGGDLFHETKPSVKAITKCLELLRKYCMGGKEIKIECLSDPEEVFKHCTFKSVNYEDPNLNIQMPVFSINGNHDDPSSETLGSMDLLAATGLVNYFGKWSNVKQMKVRPIVLRKGATHIGLYGLSYVNDQRLSRLMEDHLFNLEEPCVPDCFNILVLHQNRVRHEFHKFLPDDRLPDFLHFVLWGHEHECRITPEYFSKGRYFVSQPGSSIATSLCEGESKPKHIGILSVNRTNFKMVKLPLKTVRPFVFDNLYLKKHNIKSGSGMESDIYELIDNHIENVLIRRAATQISGHPKQPKLPLVRLRIFYTHEDQEISTIRLIQKYCNEILNPMDAIVWRKDQSGERKKKLNQETPDDLNEWAEMFDRENLWNYSVQEAVEQYFRQHQDKLTVFTVKELNDTMNRFMSYGDSDAFQNLVVNRTDQVIKSVDTATHADATQKELLDEIKKFTRIDAGENEIKVEVKEEEISMEEPPESKGQSSTSAAKRMQKKVKPSVPTFTISDSDSE